MPQPSAPSVCIVVVNYRTASLLPELLASASNVAGAVPVEVVIVDNSVDAAEFMAVTRACDNGPDNIRCTAIRAEQNLGFAAGNNLGVRSATQPFDMVVLINPDAGFASGSLDALHDEVLAHPWDTFGAGYSGVLGDQTGLVGMSLLSGRVRGVRTEDPHADPLVLPYVAGHFVATSREHWTAMEGLCEDFFLFYEEADLALRSPGRVRVAESVRVWHAKGQSMTGDGGALSPTVAEFSTMSHILLFRRHPALRHRVPLVIAARIGYLVMVTRRGGRRVAGVVWRGLVNGLRAPLSSKWGASSSIPSEAGPAREDELVYITWQRHAGRAEEIATEIGGRAIHVYPTVPGRNVALRYAVSSVSTAWTLARQRPTGVIVVNPPVVPALLVWGYAKLFRRRFVMDAHPGAFGAKHNRISARLLPMTRFLARQAAGVMVTVPEFVSVLERWKARGVIVHEAPAAATPSADARHRPTRKQVLYVCVFSPDEPLTSVLDAAALLPDIDFLVTGDLDRAPGEALASAPPNVQFVGFLDAPTYRQLLHDVDCVISLTTDPTSVMRSAYEAVYAEKPLVVSAWPRLLEYFPWAEHSADDATELSGAVVRALERSPSDLTRAREQQLQRWRLQRAALSDLLRAR